MSIKSKSISSKSTSKFGNSRARKLLERNGFYEEIVYPKVIGINPDLRIECRSIDAHPARSERGSAMGRVIVYEIAEK